ncbi:MAG: hypothetical protein KJ749_03380, partial [Planctomycetes bacterium]|nr:hypothetical protein [Planctomycetota bacterium]
PAPVSVRQGSTRVPLLLGSALIPQSPPAALLESRVLHDTAWTATRRLMCGEALGQRLAVILDGELA